MLMLFVLVVAGGVAAQLASRGIAERFDQYLIQHQAESEERRTRLRELLPSVLAIHYENTGNWDRAADVVQRVAELTEERIILSNAEGNVIVDSGGDPDSQPLPIPSAGLAPIVIDGEVIGTLHLPPASGIRKSSNERIYIDQVNRSLLIAVLVAGVVAVFLTLTLSQGILRRVKALTAAVQRMAQGDLTQRVPNNAKDEIGQLAHDFNAMADSLARIEQLRRNMVSDVAHELRTPLSNICGYLEALQDNVIQATPEAIDSLYEEALLLHRLVNDLQELAIAEAGQLKLARQPVAIGDLVDKAVQVVQGRVNGARNIRTEIAPDLPLVSVDFERIGQVLRNLLNNAVEYTPPGGNIWVGARQVRDQIQVNVYNEGGGISPVHLGNVFERFYRVDDSRTRETGGSGLGLAIVKHLVEAHSGSVWVESEPGRFANFIFTLPLGQPEPRVSSEAPGANQWPILAGRP
jgi:signal transduction histidine kinase